MANKLRKRYLVTEGDLFHLWTEVEQVRDTEKKEEFRASFLKMLQGAQEVQLVVKPKN